jgi:hypothetical protein
MAPAVVPAFITIMLCTVGWVERSETHHLHRKPRWVSLPLNPPYKNKKQKRKRNAERR